MAKSALPLLIGAAAAVFLLGKKGGGTAGTGTDDGTGNGNGTDDGGTDNGGGGTGIVGGIAQGGGVPANAWKFCGTQSGITKSATNLQGACVEIWSTEIREQLVQKLQQEYSALDAESKEAICKTVTGTNRARVEFVSDMTKDFWPELDRPDVQFPPTQGKLSGRDFPKYAYERCFGLVMANHCGAAN